MRLASAFVAALIMSGLSFACGSSSAPSDAGLTDNAPGDASNGGVADSDSQSATTDGRGDASLTSDADIEAGRDGGDADAALLDAGPSGGDASTPASDAAPSTTYMMEVTFYGWEDNSPPGDAIAYAVSDGFPTVHDVAGGSGTYADPITCATDMSEIPVGTILYAPFIEKYLVMEDDCTECDMDWSASMLRHIDVWMNSNGTENETALMACEDAWTQDSIDIEVNPPQGRTVTTTPLFDPSTNVCRTTP